MNIFRYLISKEPVDASEIGNKVGRGLERLVAGVAAATVADVAGEDVIADEGPPVHLKLGQAGGRQTQSQVQQLARGQVEVEPGRVGVALQPVVGVHHPRRVDDAQTPKLRTVDNNEEKKTKENRRD